MMMILLRILGLETINKNILICVKGTWDEQTIDEKPMEDDHIILKTRDLIIIITYYGSNEWIILYYAVACRYWTSIII